MITVTICSPNGPEPLTVDEGRGVTTILFSSNVWLADDLGVSRSTQRAKVTGSS